jgi:hypothetical protein
VALEMEDVSGAAMDEWLLRIAGDTEWEPVSTASLDFAGVAVGVYEVAPVALVGDVERTFWIAWPSNSVTLDRSAPAGAVHGRITRAGKGLQLHVWGYLHDAVQAALKSGIGVSVARLKVDGRWLDMADVYEIVLWAKTLDTGKVYEVDKLTEDHVWLFPPWSQFYRLVGLGR